jgi:hypothetical protein
MAGSRPDPAWKLDGKSLLPLLTGKKKSLPERPLFWRSNGKAGDVALREGRWKLVWRRRSAPGSAPALYDLSRDIEEKNDLAGKEPKRLAALLKKVERWESELKDPLWNYGA